MKTISRSILAFLAAVAVTFALSYGTDAILVAANLMKSNALPDSVAIVALIIAYRTVYNVLGAYIVAKLAPKRPMLHAMVLGVFGIIGALSAMAAQPDYSPAYYPVILALLILPSVWLGVKLEERSGKK
ncbi:MAG TPA: hypothetical protein VLH38_06135 [Patescibacteria group bacterium]|nr:hypothetical protein [Patescibacteria group bacterium]